MTHFGEIELVWFVLGVSRKSEQIRTHLDECSICRDSVTEIRDFESLLEDGVLWDIVDRSGGPSEEELEDGLNQLSAIMQERDFGQAVADRVMGSDNPVAEFMRVAYPTPGLCSAVVERSRLLAWSDPRLALSLQQAASKLISGESVDAILARASAFKDQANTLRMLGDFQDAYGAIRAARLEIEKTLVGGHLAAVVNLSEALVHRETERIQEALELVRAARETFLEFGDSARARHATAIEGTLLVTQGSIRLGLETLLPVLDASRVSGDLQMLGSMCLNVAYCYARLGARARANDLYLEALQIFDELGFSISKVRVRWALAQMMVEAGQFEDARRVLIDVESEFVGLGLRGEAGLVALELVEVLIQLGETSSIEQTCKRLIRHFSEIELQEHAAQALALLKELESTAVPSISVVRNVRHELRELRIFLHPEP